jgi:hypothetical protein
MHSRGYIFVKKTLHFNFFLNVLKIEHGRNIVSGIDGGENLQLPSCEFEPRSWRGVLDTTICDKVCQ